MVYEMTLSASLSYELWLYGSEFCSLFKIIIFELIM